MGDDIPRREVFLSGAAAGLAALAGCDAFRRDVTDTPPTATDGGADTTTATSRDDDGSGSVSPLSFHGALGQRFADEFVDDRDADPMVVDAAAAFADPGELVFGTGTYTAAQFRTPEEVDYNDVSYYLRGAGVRNTSLVKRPVDGHFLFFDDGRSDEFGNFGGVSRMGVYGGKLTHQQPSEGNLVHSNGLIIDLLFENLIVRYGYGDGVHVDRSASGTRLHNSWIENNDGWGVFFEGGTRAKVSNLHVIQNGAGGVYFDTDSSQLTGLTLHGNAPGLEMRGNSNSVSNVYVQKSSLGVRERGDAKNNTYANFAFDGVETGVLADGTGASWGNLAATNTDTVLHVRGDRNVVSGVNARDATLRVGDGATENVLSNVVADVEDDGVRTVVDGRATNGGDPRTAGEWHGHAAFAHATNALVWDVSTSPRTAYRADDEGAWHPV